RQRGQQGLLSARARQEPRGEALSALSGGPGLHPLRRLRRDPEPALQAAREVEAPRHVPPLPPGGEGRAGGRRGMRPLRRRASEAGSSPAWAVFTLLAFSAVAAGALYVAGVFDTPRVDSRAPHPARPGEQVLLKGARFASQVGGNIVLFGDKAGRIVQAAPGSILVEVPDLGVPGGGVRVPVRVLVGSRVSTVYDLALAAGSGAVS